MSLARTTSKNITDIMNELDDFVNSLMSSTDLSKPETATLNAELLEEDVYGEKSPLRPSEYDYSTKVNYLLEDINGPISPYKASGKNVSFQEVDSSIFEYFDELITIQRNKRIRAEEEKNIHDINIVKWDFELKKVKFEIQSIQK